MKSITIFFAIYLSILSLFYITNAQAAVVVFTQPGCSGCQQVKFDLYRAKVPFRTCDIMTNQQCQQAFQSNGGIGTPMVAVDGVYLPQPSRTDLFNLLRAKGYLKK